jgi:hypothetical protein
VRLVVTRPAALARVHLCLQQVRIKLCVAQHFELRWGSDHP